MLEAFLTMFVFGGFWFWALIAVASFLVIVSLEQDNEFCATVLTIGSLAAILFLGNTGLFSWVIAHPWYLLAGITGYLGIGVCYGVLKWWLLVRDTVERYIEKRTNWLEGKILEYGSMPEKVALYKDALNNGISGNIIVISEWRKYIKKSYYKYSITKPLVSRNKSRIIGWMSYWLWSGLWTLINDPIRRAFRIVYCNIRGFLQAISDRIYADIDEELGE